MYCKHIGQPSLDFRYLGLILFVLIGSVFGANSKRIQLSNEGTLSADEIWGQMQIPDGFDTLTAPKRIQILGFSMESIQELCAIKGYFLCKAVSLPIGDSIYQVNVKSGPRFKMTNFEIDRLDSLASLSEDSLANLQWKKVVNDNYDQSEQSAIFQKIQTVYQDAGYLHVSIISDIAIDTSSQSVKLIFKVQTRAKVRMRNLVIHLSRGAKDPKPALTQSQAIRKLWPFKPGEAIRQDAYYSFRQKLLQTGLFNQVVIKDTLIDSLSNVIVNCTERVPGTMQMQMFYSYDQVNNFGISATLSHNNVDGNFHQVSTDGVLAWREQRLGFGYSHPLFLGFPLRFEEHPFWEHDLILEPIKNFNFDKWVATNRVSLNQNLGEHWSWQLISDFGYRSILVPLNVDTSNTGLGNSNELQIRIDPTLQFSWVNDELDPTKGYRATARVANGGGFDVERRFFTGRFDQHAYVPLGRGWVWACEVDMGEFFMGNDPIEALNFYQGGPRSVRGYESRAIQPNTYTLSSVVDNNGSLEEVLTRTQSLYSQSPEYLRISNELRIPMWHNEEMGFGAVLFQDWAYIADRQNPALISTRAMSIGPGLRFKYSVISLRIDYAWWKNVDNLQVIEPFALGRFSIDLSQAI